MAGGPPPFSPIIGIELFYLESAKIPRKIEKFGGRKDSSFEWIGWVGN